MKTVSVRELRNHGGAVLARVARGEVLTVTSDGAEVAELRPLPRRSPSTAQLIRNRRTLPAVDPAALRSDLDELLDPTL
ncbi:type II toxin-antitoxin system Phd/YefM family antitoxin [Agromyces aerolatus]|uniref:type II toxin-antitoxin system Phd/YefM family antitoxin n=1 Tax=Agromyces sp. LY-1074 TaxID=3074080 RepID=UPI00286338DA|nr:MULTISPECIES: type II toxin-antitoxin system prevent-host-death family antitoxin [unclassified Agromyces]MDR5698617.1 type II toxin-antitoxin system prevent-host-death family antitoxin [Agromyces sp. LY-1074]MDR5704911.1 type II toxin-antitoxin system prevent-host-death family antitoxin [Agromyces sp. LY-1358]